MFWTKKVIGDGERGLVYRNRQFAGVIAPDVYKRFDPFGEVEVKVHNIALRSEYTRSDENALIDALGSRLAGTFVLADLGVGDVGLVARRAPGGVQSFSTPFSTTGFPSSMTVAPGRNTTMPYGMEFSPPAHELPPAPTVTAPAGIQLPIWLFAGSVTLGLMPKSRKPTRFLRGSSTASYSALKPS